MIATIGLGLFLVVIAGLSEGVMDTLQFHFGGSVFNKYENQDFWNPELSWMNKYKEDLKTPSFFLSTSLFVGLTDAWHLFKMIRTLCLFIGTTISVYNLDFIELCIVFIIARILFGLTFTLSFEIFSNK